MLNFKFIANCVIYYQAFVKKIKFLMSISIQYLNAIIIYYNYLKSSSIDISAYIVSFQ